MKDDFSIKLEGVEKALRQFDSKTVIRAARSAVNDVATQGKNEAVRIIKSEYNIKPSRLKQYLKLTAKAAGNSLQAIITGKGMGLALSYFDARQTGVVANRKGFRYTRRAGKQGNLRYGGAVTALVKRAGGRKEVSGKYGNKPFIAKMKSGHTGVWVRQGKKPKPIEQLYGPGVGGLFGTKNVMDRTKKVINEKFKPRFDYWFSRYFREAR